MKKKYKIFIFVLVLLVLLAPALSFAAGLVPCGGSDEAACDFRGLMSLINTVINFLLFDLALPIAAIMFAYAGFKLVTAGGGEGKSQAKNIFTSVVFGLLAALIAWIIIHTLLTIVGYDGSWIGL